MLDENKNREINIIYPNGNSHHIITQYVQKTNDGKYVLNYLDLIRDDYIPSFTEIIKIDGEWAKNPFHDNYEEYDFEDFDNDLSKEIIKELPDNLKIRIRIMDDRKKINEKTLTTNSKLDINVIGTKEITNKITKEVHCVLVANDGNDKINKNYNYLIDFPFPVFSLDGKIKHNEYIIENDPNSGLEFEEFELSRIGLSNNIRKNITNLLNKAGDIIDISYLPTLESYDDITKEKYIISFVPCPNYDIFSEIYKSKCVRIDSEMIDSNSIEELFKEALNNQIPYSYETNSGLIKNNGIKHNVKVK